MNLPAGVSGRTLFDREPHDWGGFLAWALPAKHPDRVQTLTVLSTSHVDAFLEAVASDPDQKARSQYIQFFKMPGQAADAVFLKDDGARPSGIFQGKVPEDKVAQSVARLLEPGALTAAINWYRATRASVFWTPPLRWWLSVGFGSSDLFFRLW
jgi:pimeloyl-ACP methyl ester carboxylesterase